MSRFVSLGCGLVLLGLTSCKHGDVGVGNNRYQNPSGAPKGLVDPKYTLQADREAIEALRKDVPPEKRAANDEEAFIPQLFAEGKRSPDEIRRTFDQLVHKKRELFDRDMKKEREVFQDQNKRQRDGFLSRQDKERTEFQRGKNSRDATNDFYNDQDSKRKAYFADERERSDDFESQMRDKRHDFDDYMRAKNTEFTEGLKAYSEKKK